MRKAAESRDTYMVVKSAIQFATASQVLSVLDYIDGDEYIQIKKDASRAPQRLLRTDDEVAALRGNLGKQQQ